MYLKGEKTGFLHLTASPTHPFSQYAPQMKAIDASRRLIPHTTQTQPARDLQKSFETQKKSKSGSPTVKIIFPQPGPFQNTYRAQASERPIKKSFKKISLTIFRQPWTLISRA